MSGTSARSLHRHFSMRHPRTCKSFTTALVVASRTPPSLIKMPVTLQVQFLFHISMCLITHDQHPSQDAPVWHFCPVLRVCGHYVRVKLPTARHSSHWLSFLWMHWSLACSQTPFFQEEFLVLYCVFKRCLESQPRPALRRLHAR